MDPVFRSRSGSSPSCGALGGLKLVALLTGLQLQPAQQMFAVATQRTFIPLFTHPKHQRLLDKGVAGAGRPPSLLVQESAEAAGVHQSSATLS